MYHISDEALPKFPASHKMLSRPNRNGILKSGCWPTEDVVTSSRETNRLMLPRKIMAAGVNHVNILFSTPYQNPNCFVSYIWW